MAKGTRVVRVVQGESAGMKHDLMPEDREDWVVFISLLAIWLGFMATIWPRHA